MSIIETTISLRTPQGRIVSVNAMFQQLGPGSLPSSRSDRTCQGYDRGRSNDFFADSFGRLCLVSRASHSLSTSWISFAGSVSLLACSAIDIQLGLDSMIRKCTFGSLPCLSNRAQLANPPTGTVQRESERRVLTPFHSVESRALTHLDSMGALEARFSSQWVGRRPMETHNPARGLAGREITREAGRLDEKGTIKERIVDGPQR
jgi:hypothetical protein